jgi:regulator of protease activity HflC (stomatin/prohibitin superfamily)
MGLDYGRSRRMDEDSTLGGPPDWRKVAWTIGACLVAFVVLWWLIGIRSVSTGHLGIIKTGGRISDVVQPGYTHVWVGVQSFDDVLVQGQTVAFQQIDASTRELQSLHISGTLIYGLGCSPNSDPKRCNVERRVVDIYTRIGTDSIEGRLIQPFLTDLVKEVTPQYPAADSVDKDGNLLADASGVPLNDGILHHRDQIRSTVLSKLNALLDAHYPGVYVTDLALVNMDFSPQFDASVEAKQVAAQGVLKAQQEQRTAAIDADTRVLVAKRDAEANAILQQSLTPSILEQQAIHQWHGEMPMVVGSGGMPFININPSGQPGQR